jgi:hypothetical protein
VEENLHNWEGVWDKMKDRGFCAEYGSPHSNLLLKTREWSVLIDEITRCGTDRDIYSKVIGGNVFADKKNYNLHKGRQ